jgi:hypothetical protein
MELLQIALEKLRFLKSLRVRMNGCNYSLVKYQPSYNIEENDEIYIKEQAEKTAKLIGENYERFEHFLLALGPRCWKVLSHREKYYPKVEYCFGEPLNYDEIEYDREFIEATEKPLKVVVLLW